MRKIMTLLPILVALVTLTILPRAAAAQDDAAPAAKACPAGQMCPMQGDHASMMEKHQAMMESHQQAMARLQELQDRMHAATGATKVDAMAALLDEMVGQHKAMHEMMMEAGGMGHEGMMEHEGMDHEKHEGMDHDQDDDGGSGGF